MPGTDGFVMVPNSLLESKLSIWAKSVWIALKYHADRNGGCYPSREVLAALSGMSVAQVKRAIKELKQAGMIDAQLRTGCTSVYGLAVGSIRPGSNGASRVYQTRESGPIDPGVGSNRPDTLFPTDSDEQDLRTRPKNKRRKLLVGDEKFDEFWKEYPLKIDKQDAIKAWQEAHINGEFDQVLTALRKQKQSHKWLKDNGEFIPHPATWIHKRRWEYEPMENTNGRTTNGRESVRPNCRVEATEQQLDAIRRKTIRVGVANGSP